MDIVFEYTKLSIHAKAECDNHLRAMRHIVTESSSEQEMFFCLRDTIMSHLSKNLNICPNLECMPRNPTVLMECFIMLKTRHDIIEQYNNFLNSIVDELKKEEISINVIKYLLL